MSNAPLNDAPKQVTVDFQLCEGFISIDTFARFETFFTSCLADLSDQMVELQPYRIMTIQRDRPPYGDKIILTRTGKTFEIILSHQTYFQHFVIRAHGIMRNFWDKLRDCTWRYVKDQNIGYHYFTTLYFADPRHEQFTNGIRAVLTARPSNHLLVKRIAELIHGLAENELALAVAHWDEFCTEIEQGKFTLPTPIQRTNEATELVQQGVVPAKNLQTEEIAQLKRELERVRDANKELGAEVQRLRTERQSNVPLQQVATDILRIKQLPTDPTLLTVAVTDILMALSSYIVDLEIRLNQQITTAYEEIASLSPLENETPEIIKEQIQELTQHLGEVGASVRPKNLQDIYESRQELMRKLAAADQLSQALPAAQAKLAALDSNRQILDWLQRIISACFRQSLMGPQEAPAPTETSATLPPPPTSNGACHAANSEQPPTETEITHSIDSPKTQTKTPRKRRTKE